MNEELGMRNEEWGGEDALPHVGEGLAPPADAAESTESPGLPDGRQPHVGEGLAPPADAEESTESPSLPDGRQPPLGKGAREERGGMEPGFPLWRAHFDALCAQAAVLEREIPGFDLDTALRDKDFLRLTSPAVGVSVRAAWYALHGPERERQAARRAYDSAAEALARSAARPREGGRGVSGGALSRSDPRALDPGQRAALRQRIYDAAARGEKVYP